MNAQKKEEAKMTCGQYFGCAAKILGSFLGFLIALGIAGYAFILASGGIEIIGKTLDGTLPMNLLKWLGHFAVFWGVLLAEILVALLVVVTIKSKKARSKEIVFYALILAAMAASGILGFITVNSAAEKNSYTMLLIGNTIARYFVLFGVLLLFLKEKFLGKKPAEADIDYRELIFELLRTLERQPELRQTFLTYIFDAFVVSDDELIERFVTRLKLDDDLRRRLLDVLDQEVLGENIEKSADGNYTDPTGLSELLKSFEEENKLDEAQKRRLEQKRLDLDEVLNG